MLASEYKKNAHKVKFPCFIQPKLDGYRMIYDGHSQKCTSRTGKEFSVVYNTQLYRELIQNFAEYCLDGELYTHTELAFEEYGVLRKTTKLTAADSEKLERIEYHVYDIIDKGQKMTFGDRKVVLDRLQERVKGLDKIKIVDTLLCNSKDDIDAMHSTFVGDSYEGSIVRNAGGVYKCKFRSYDLLKYKDFDDSEFRIVDYTSEMDTTGNNEPLIVWVCETESGKRFNVQSKGTRSERKSIYQTANEYIGKPLWVQFFGYTSDGIPRFPKTARAGLSSIRGEVL
jgi:ATP-dependent DNA ligase